MQQDQIATQIFKALEYNLNKDRFTVFIVDSTSTNTRYTNSTVAHLEKLLERRIHLIGCSLRLNKFPSRAVFEKLDGKTTGSRSFTGIIWKLCCKDIHLKPPVQLKKVFCTYLSFNPNDSFDDLSWDQQLVLLYLRAIIHRKVDIQ